MCLDPFSMLLISGAATALGAGVSAFGKIKEGKAQADQAERNAIAANKNADELDYQAEQRIKKMAFDVDAATRAYQRHRGKVRADASKSGFDMRNFYDVLEDDAREAKMEVEAIKYQAGQEVRGLKYQAAGERWEAEDNLKAGKGYRDASYISAAGSVISGVSSLASGNIGVGFGSGWGQSANPSSSSWHHPVPY